MKAKEDGVRRFVWCKKSTSLCRAVRRRAISLLKEQGGFTLPEVMVSLVLMILVFFALHSILDTSVRVLSVANDHNEVDSNARPAMERMARELRAAYPATTTGACTSTTAGTLLVAPAPTTSKITFCNMGSSGIQKVSYYQKTYSSSNGAQTIGLYRQQNDGAEEIMAVLGPTSPSPTGSVAFSYYDSSNTQVNPTTVPESSIYLVKITLNVKVASSGLNQSGGTQTLTSYVSLRNR